MDLAHTLQMGVKKNFLLVILFIALTSSKSLGAPLTCEDIFRYPLWILAPHSQQLVVGMLVETILNQEVMAIEDYYWGSHEEIYRQLSKEYRIKRILWAGEILLENPKPETDLASIVLTLNTSGFAWKLNQESNFRNNNEPQSLKLILETYRPDLITEFTQYLEYSEEHVHLDPLFQRLHDRGHFNPLDTVRHRFRNVLDVIYNLSSYLVRHPGLSSDKESGLMSKVSPQTIDDILLFMEASSRYSRVMKGSHHNTSEEFQNLRQQLAQKDRDFMTFLELIKEAGPRVLHSHEDADVIVLNPSGT